MAPSAWTHVEAERTRNVLVFVSKYTKSELIVMEKRT